jgi:hypothetical protein
MMVVCILGEGERNGVICRGRVSYILFHLGLGPSVTVSLLGLRCRPGTIQHRIHYTLLLLLFLLGTGTAFGVLQLFENRWIVSKNITGFSIGV